MLVTILRMESLRGIIRDLERQRAQLDQALRMLYALGDVSTRSPRTGRRKLSAAGRRRIAAAQRARWAKWKRDKKK